jgi:ATP-binding cassette subfamily B protein
MKDKMMEHALSLPPGTFDEIGSGSVRRVMNETVDDTHAYFAHKLQDISAALVLPIALLVMMFFFDWRLGLACLVPIFIAVYIHLMLNRRKDMFGYTRHFTDTLEEMNAESVEYVRGISVVKTFQQTVESFQRFKGVIHEYAHWMAEYTIRFGRPYSFYYVISNSVFAFVITAAVFLFGTGPITSTEYANLMFYLILTPLFPLILSKVMDCANAFYKMDDVMERVDEFFSRKPLPEPEQGSMPISWDIAFKDVTFTYSGQEKAALNNISLTSKQGKVTAIVGASGSGKSTIASLASRFWDPDSGAITIGGIDLKDIGSKNLRKIESYVFQGSRLIKGTLRDNVRLGRPDASEEEIIDALHDAQCDDIVEKLPDGLDTLLGPGGVYLSGGEVQRISIARAILRNCPIVVLDEATAFADPENEYLVQKAFEKLSKDKTVLIIAHRLSTVRHADLIYVIRAGEVAESGTHEELLGQGGLYKGMWEDYQLSLKWKVKGVKE